ncbi:ABC transporter ATP-binding protein [Adlercreutzia murintestinalis]|uniref:ABC transporter ATP-binding protein n=1 Tax=Adlercreutzia murintestinalis TaxID=2941325 RepID=UPI00204207FE|nr:dipeptide/oligopeptide/nickel ABC transporter ATP-binding protein [Adlercreutzia murintestinalis]
MSDRKTLSEEMVAAAGGALASDKAKVRSDAELYERATIEAGGAATDACGTDTDGAVACETPASHEAIEAEEEAFEREGVEPIIFLDNIEVTFKTRTGSLLHPNLVHAVRGLTLKLWPGETIGIVGESGCGKSTTANVMCGLQSPTSGRVFFKGKDVTHRTAADRRVIGRVISVVFQDPATALNARMSVREQLLDPMIVHKVGTKEERERRVHDLIGMVGLPQSALEALPGQLSGGQRQRVAIARALALKPDAIIADEPTSALDVSVRAQILNLLMDLKKELGLAMVFISHDIQTVRYISDRIIVMNAGRAVERGTAEQVFNDPQDSYTRLLLGAAPSLLHPELGK